MVLASVACAQLMIGVDATILSVALPELVGDLGLGPSAAAWVMAGYVLASGSLMIPAGRVAQSVGYARLMGVGLVAFGVASVVAGIAHGPAVVVSARVGQGVAAAAVTPAAMARLSSAFEGPQRAKAYGVFGTIMGAGTAIGLTLGGLLAQLGGWRACMFVNVAFVVAALAFGARAHDAAPGAPGHAQGAWRGLLVAAGVAALIQAMMQTGHVLSGLAWLAGAVAALGSFMWLDRASPTPLAPGSLLASPARRAAYLALLLWGVATIAAFVHVSNTLQSGYHLAPLVVGLLVLVYPAGIQVGLFISRRRPASQPARVLGVGLVLVALGQGVLALSSASVLASLTALAVMGGGTSLVMPTANSEMNRDAGEHVGVAGAIGTTLQQLGASIGLALPVALTPVGAEPARSASGITAAALVAAAVFLLTRSSKATHPKEVPA